MKGLYFAIKYDSNSTLINGSMKSITLVEVGSRISPKAMIFQTD